MSRIILLIHVLVLASVMCVSAQTIDNFDSGDLSAWNITAPYYTTIGLATPGAGGSGRALAITETPMAAHSENALVHRVFTTPQNWGAYVALELDAKADSADWNGYSIRVNNAGSLALLRGIRSDESTADYRRIRFDISGIARDQINEIVIYVNRTKLSAGQTLTIDNIQLSTTPVSTPSEVVVADFDTIGADITRWQDPPSWIYQTTASLVADAAPNNNVVALTLSGTSPSAYGQCALPQTLDWYDYKTLQFEAKLAAGTITDGFSVRVYNQGDTRNLRTFQGYGGKIGKFIPSAGGYATCKVDISGMTRDQVSSLMFYINRTGANGSQVVRIDNIKLTKEVLSIPDVVYIDQFDTYADNTALAVQWDWAYNCARGLNTTDFISAGKSMDVALSGTSASAYVRRNWTAIGQPSQDWSDYKSLMFEAKVTNATLPTYPVGFSMNVVNGTGGSHLWFYPSALDQWETIALDISGMACDQVTMLRIYLNRASRSDTNETLRIDDLRVSKEPAPPIEVNNPNVDDFEDGNIDDWYYSSIHTDPNNPGNYLSGTSAALTTDAAGGQYALKITNNTPPGSSSAYRRKSLQADWSGYTTLQFDAKVANSATSQGFTFTIGDFAGLQTSHQFCPTSQWKTFKIDIRPDTRTEVVRLLFYVNRINGYGKSQSGAQELYLDNIKLTTEALPTTFDTIGSAMACDDGAWATLDGKVCTGQFDAAIPDRNSPSMDTSTWRKVIFIEEADRSSAVPVVFGFDASTLDIPAGTKVKVTGLVTTGVGTRYLYCDALTKITIQGSGFAIPNPVGLTNKASGSGSRYLDAGVPGFTGISTTGMYSIVFGKVVAVGNSPDYSKYWLYIDDGSGVQADNGAIGVKVYDFTGGTYADPANVGKMAIISGFVMNDPEIDFALATPAPTGNAVRAIWPKADLTTPIRFINP